MSYRYEDERPKLFTEEGQVMLIKARDEALRLLHEAGAFVGTRAFKGLGGDSWTMMAVLDRLVELGDLRELTGPEVWGQDRVFVSGMVRR